MITITSTRDIAASTVKMLVVGESGVGKTKLAKTLADAGQQVLILSAESGLLSLRGTDIHAIEIGKDVNPVDHLKEVYAWLMTERPAYDWLFIDSLTEITQRQVAYLKLLYPDRKDRFPLWEEYADTIRALIKDFRDQSLYSVVFTALVKVDSDKDGRRFYGISMEHKTLRQDLPALFDEVFAMRILPDENGLPGRWLVTQPHEDWLGKDRSGALELFEKPDLAAITAKILGGN
jgi:hypothetical protein